MSPAAKKSASKTASRTKSAAAKSAPKPKSPTTSYTLSNGTVRFRTKLIADHNSSACSVNFPFDLKDVFGKTRIPVRITLNEHPFRTTTFSMHGTQFFVVNKEMRDATGLSASDHVDVTMALDTEERTVEVPAELQSALAKHPAQREYFDSLSFTHRKEFARWIAGAKQAETRDRRIAKCIDMLKRREAPHF